MEREDWVCHGYSFKEHSCKSAADVDFLDPRNVQVTLQILASLIEKVPRDLPLYARSVLTILDTILRSHEISIVEESIPTFEVFCRHQDLTTLSADHEYVGLYRNIVKMYAGFASGNTTATPSKSPLGRPVALRWANIGLQAIKSIVDSESLAMDGPKLLEITIPVVLRNLYSTGDFSLSPLQKRAESSETQERELQSRRRRRSVATVQTVDTIDGRAASASGTTADADIAAETEARVLSLRCLEKIFMAGTNRGQIHTAAKLVLDFFITSGHKESARASAGQTWATDFLETVVNWTPVQDRFIILVTLVEKLVEQPLVSEQLGSQLTLASLIDWLLSSPINLIGLSVLDGLIELLQYLLALLHQESQLSRQLSSPSGPPPQGPEHQETGLGTEHDANEKPERPPSTLRRELVDLLEKCIGSLATHIYYADQVSDMVQNVISRLRPSTPPSEEETMLDESPNAQQNGRPRDTYFSFPEARTSGLKAIQNILVVANLRKSLAGTGPDSGNRVPIQVWEGTQWLLRDSDRDVRHAYVDAFITWLQLETDKNDLKAQPESSRRFRSATPKRHRADSPDALARKVASLAPPKDYTVAGAGTKFLQSLHLAVYEAASESAPAKSDFLVLHLLLVNLVENIGVNAVRHSLPVIMRLQTDYLAEENDYTPDQRCNMGSLVHGCLWAMVQKFNLEETRVGAEIMDEISKRKKRGIWCDKIQLPPRPLSYIGAIVDSTVNQKRSLPSTLDAYSPFTSVHELVSQIEHAYAKTFASPQASPTISPRRPIATSSVGQSHATSSKSQQGPGLPTNVKDQMLSSWSKEACLATLESEKAKSSTGGSGSRSAGARARLAAINGSKLENGPPASAAGAFTDSPISFGDHRGRHVDRPASSTLSLDGVPKIRRASAMDEPPQGSANGSSRRDSTVKVNELRRVLSVVNDGNVRRPSPLRKRTRVGSDISSTDSMVTDTVFTASEVDVSGAATAPDVHQSIHEEEAETPKASSTTHLHTDAHDEHQQHNEKSETSNHQHSSSIPPVPPLPSSLAIPGGFPESASASSAGASPAHSPIRSERPRTAPSVNAAPAAAAATTTTTTNSQEKSNPTVHRSRSFTRKSFRPMTQDSGGLSTSVSGRNDTERSAARASRHKASRHPSLPHNGHGLSLGRREDVEKLLEGLGPSDIHAPVQKQQEQSHGKSKAPVRDDPLSSFIAISNNLGVNSTHNPAVDVDGRSSSRHSRTGIATRGGIGPPPY